MAVNFNAPFPVNLFPNPSDGSTFSININYNGEPLLEVINDAQGGETFSKVIIVENADNKIYVIDPAQKLAAGFILFLLFRILLL